MVSTTYLTETAKLTNVDAQAWHASILGRTFETQFASLDALATWR
ncbi:MAG: hypothetical protein QNJ13_12485 [Paracoccaceae bacterium]|nr:hypothetical protein [Paracoccaceae bacterium]